MLGFLRSINSSSMFEAALGNSCRITIRARTARFNVSANE
ncbi:hypothetical protein FOMA001_g3071 [Fusarium oxysporum f. sp. matthiolae]|nr:hypothetical protein FOMA001_g3071 [Fusarium oxysporum f. sp. matthiolae]